MIPHELKKRHLETHHAEIKVENVWLAEEQTARETKSDDWHKEHVLPLV